MHEQYAIQEIGSQCPCSSTAQQDELAGQRSVIRLSWPRESDKRRAIVSQTPALSEMRQARISSDANVSDARFVHVSYWDVERHDRSAKQGHGHMASRLLQIPWTPWNPSKLQAADRDLLEYFHCEASKSLAIFGHDPAKLGSTLIRIALASDTPSSAAVLRGILAFSSLHRNGVHLQAVELKVATIKQLTESSSSGCLDTIDTVQHVAVGMLLCSFEIHQESCTSEQWTEYLALIKQIIDTSFNDTLLHDGDVTVLLDWVYYHHALARFSLRHWHREITERAAISSHPTYVSRETSAMSPSAVAILDHLSQIHDQVPADGTINATFDSVDDYKGFLSVLHWRIRNIRVSVEYEPGEKAVSAADTITLPMKLYKLALLIYLERTCGNLLSPVIKSDQYIDEAFAMLPRISSCERQFPVFIIGIEARTDEQRVLVLDLISRTEVKGSSRSYKYVVNVLQAIWAQNDLAGGGKMGYGEMLSSVITRCLVTPTFV